MKKILILTCLGLSYFLSGCATATRGSNSNFIIETIPVGAHITTTVPVQGSERLSRHQIKRIRDGKRAAPLYTYRSCEPSPCGIIIPRKTEFDILITKEGFAPQIHTIGFKHRKAIARETARNTAIAAGTVSAGGIALAAGVSTSLGTTLSVGAAASGAAIIAAPIVAIGLVFGGVDAASGANFDFWPNPALAQLGAAGAETDHQAILTQFEQHREIRKLTIKPTVKQRRSKKENEKKARVARAKAERKAVRDAKIKERKANRKK